MLSSKTHSTVYSDYSAVVCISAETFKDTKLPLPNPRKHQNTEQYKGLDDCGQIDLNSNVNQPVSGKLRKSTTISSQCDQFP